MNPSFVTRIIETIIVGCLMGTAYKFYDVATTGSFATSDMIIRFFILVVITTFLFISSSFFNSIIAYTNETKYASGLTLGITSFYSLFLYIGANKTIYSLISISFLLLLIKSYQLYQSAKNKNYHENIVQFFYKYVKSYFFAFLTTAIVFFLVDFKIISFNDIYNKYFSSPTPKEFLIIEAELAKLKTIPNIDLSALQQNISSVSNQLSTLNITIAIIASLTMIIFAIFLFNEIFKKKTLSIEEANKILKKQFNSTGGDDSKLSKFSNLKSIIFITRPLVSTISGIISSVIYFTFSNNFHSAQVLFLVVFLTTAFGFAINDYFDIEKDKINHPDRILPQGHIKPIWVILFCVLLSITSLYFSFILSSYVFYINLITLALLSVYSIINNRYGVIANIITAFCSALALLITKIELNFDIVMVASISTFLVILSREIIFDVQDIEGDKSISKTSIPILLGISKANKIAGILLLLNTVLTILSAYYFSSISFLIYIGIFANVLLWLSYIVYVLKPNSKTELIYTNLTRLAFLLIIPAILFSH